MRAFVIGGIVLGLLASGPAAAQSAFDGTWKANLATAQMPKKPDVYLLKGGMWECKTCVPSIRVAADGMDHAVTGHPYFDSVAVKVVDANTVEQTNKKAGKVVNSSKTMVSADGKTATFEFTDSSNTSGAPVTGKGTQTRVGAVPTGAHATSGSWVTTSYSGISDNGLTTTYKVEGDSLMMTSPTGQKYSAKLDGTAAPFMGDPGITTVSVKKLGANEVEETDKRDGKTVGIAKMIVAKDGKSMTVHYRDTLHGTSMSYTADKQ